MARSHSYGHAMVYRFFSYVVWRCTGPWRAHSPNYTLTPPCCHLLAPDDDARPARLFPFPPTYHQRTHSPLPLGLHTAFGTCPPPPHNCAAHHHPPTDGRRRVVLPVRVPLPPPYWVTNMAVTTAGPFACSAPCAPAAFVCALLPAAFYAPFSHPSAGPPHHLPIWTHGMV